MAKCIFCGGRIFTVSHVQEYSDNGILNDMLKYGFYRNIKPKIKFCLCPGCKLHLGRFLDNYTMYIQNNRSLDNLKDTYLSTSNVKFDLAKQKYCVNFDAKYLTEQEDIVNSAIISVGAKEYRLRDQLVKEIEKKIEDLFKIFKETYSSRVFPQDPKYHHVSAVKKENALVLIENNHPQYEHIAEKNDRSKLTLTGTSQIWSKYNTRCLETEVHPQFCNMDIKEMFAITTIPLSDIISFQLVGNVDRVATTSGGGGGSSGPNIGGAIVGGLLFGTVGAIIGAQAGTGVNINPIQSTINEYDTRRTLLNLKNADGVAEIRELPFYYAEIFTKVIPEKEFSFLQAERNSSTAPVKENPQNDNAIEAIKKFKELLDMGIITQEEFDAKKKQLLGL